MGSHHNHSQLTIEEGKKLETWDKRYVWHPFTQMQDYRAEPTLIFSRGEGAYLFDIHGNKYFDANSSLWVNIHGHCRKEINDAITAQLNTLAHSTLLGPGNIPSIELAKRLVDITPEGLETVFYSDNGSTAVEVALKMAFQYWIQTKKTKPEKLRFIKFDEAYHGDTLGSVSVGGIDLFHGTFGPLLFDCHSVSYPLYSKYKSTQTPEDTYKPSLDACKAIFEQNPGEVPAIIIEPLIQGAGGMRTCAPGFLSELRQLCDRHGTLLILDEVFTGFGRTGTLFACEQESVSPDIIALSKGLTAGYMPLAVTLTTKMVYQGFLGNYADFKTFFHGHSYTGNQLGCRAALACLDVFEADRTLENIQPVIQHLAQKLDWLFHANDKIDDVRQCGLIAGIDICASRTRRESYNFVDKMGAKCCVKMREKGIWIRPLGNTIILVPPLITQTKEIDLVIDSLNEVLLTF